MLYLLANISHYCMPKTFNHSKLLLTHRRSFNLNIPHIIFLLALNLMLLLTTLQALGSDLDCTNLLSSAGEKYYLIDPSESVLTLPVHVDESLLKSLKRRGEYQQNIGAIVDHKGQPVLFGYVARLKEILHSRLKLVSEIDKLSAMKPVQSGSSTVKTIRGNVGSYFSSQYAEDIDMILTLMVSDPDFSEEWIRNKKGNYYQLIELTLKAFIEKQINAGLIFSDFKAGHYSYIPKDRQKTQSDALKWNLEELFSGQKEAALNSIEEIKRIDLSEALAMDGRIKIDFYKEVDTSPELIQKGAPQKSLIEVSYYIMLGGKRPGGLPILRTSPTSAPTNLAATGAYLRVEEQAYLKPLRRGSLYFTYPELEQALNLTLTSSFSTPKQLNTLFTSAILQYAKTGNLYKAIKLLRGRMDRWPDTQYLALGVSTTSLAKLLDSLIYDKKLIEIKHYLDQMEICIDLGEEGGICKDYLRHILNSYKIKSKTYLGAVKYLEILFQKRILDLGALETLQPILSKMKSFEYIKGISPDPTDKKAFVALVPKTEKAKKIVGSLLRKFQKKYPSLKFTNPLDYHITLAYVGPTTEVEREEILKLLPQLALELKSHSNEVPLELLASSINFVGKNNSQLAFIYDSYQEATEEISKTISSFKISLYNKIGSIEKRDFDEFLLHSSILHLPNDVDKKALHRFIAENSSIELHFDISDFDLKLVLIEDENNISNSPRYTHD